MANASKVSALLNRLATGAVVLGTGASLAQASFYTVDGGERAVLFDRLRGVLDDTASEGMHFLVRTRHPHPPPRARALSTRIHQTRPPPRKPTPERHPGAFSAVARTPPCLANVQ